MLTLNNNKLPDFITESSSSYLLSINYEKSSIMNSNIDLMFKVIDHWGNPFYTNSFSLISYVNKSPVIVERPKDAVLYRGQEYGVIPTPSNMFYDPGDTLTITTTKWTERSATNVVTIFDRGKNEIDVWYPFQFIGQWTFALVAQDSANNIASIVITLNVESWNQEAWNKCSGRETQNWQQWESGYILNLKNGIWVPMLTLSSIEGLNSIGVIFFILIALYALPVSI